MISEFNQKNNMHVSKIRDKVSKAWDSNSSFQIPCISFKKQYFEENALVFIGVSNINEFLLKMLTNKMEVTFLIQA